MFLVHGLLQFLMFVGMDANYCIGTFPLQQNLVNTAGKNFTAFFSLDLLDGHIGPCGDITRFDQSVIIKENNEEGGIAWKVSHPELVPGKAQALPRSFSGLIQVKEGLVKAP